jgi:drug/metabolite transporter (DMT)-like permease
MNPPTPITPTLPTRSRLSTETSGMLLGLIGVAIFSLTLPMTRLAVGGGHVAGLSPLFVALARALAAAALAAGWLYWKRAPLPPRSALPALAMVAAGCVIGFP